MAKEIEAKFININKDDIILKLKQLGAELVYEERLLRRRVYDLSYPKAGAWARVRDEVDKITMTYKRVSDSSSIQGTYEVELVVNSFEDAASFLKACKVHESSYQENYREKWSRGNVEVCIDTWP